MFDMLILADISWRAVPDFEILADQLNRFFFFFFTEGNIKKSKYVSIVTQWLLLCTVTTELYIPPK